MIELVYTWAFLRAALIIPALPVLDIVEKPIITWAGAQPDEQTPRNKLQINKARDPYKPPPPPPKPTRPCNPPQTIITMRSFALIPFFLSAAVSAYHPNFTWLVQARSGVHCEGDPVGEEWHEDRTDQCITINQWEDMKSLHIEGTNSYTFYKDADCHDFLVDSEGGGWQGCATTGEYSDWEIGLSQAPRSLRVRVHSIRCGHAGANLQCVTGRTVLNSRESSRCRSLRVPSMPVSGFQDSRSSYGLNPP